MKKMFLLICTALLVTSGQTGKADFILDTPMNLGPPVNMQFWECDPSISADGLSLFFTSGYHRGGVGDWDMWLSTRIATDAPWSEPENLGEPVNSSWSDWGAEISADGLSLCFASTRRRGSGGFDIWVTTRATTSDAWSEPVNVGTAVNSDAEDSDPIISADGLSLYFSSDRPGGQGTYDLYVSTRQTSEGDWGPPMNLGPTVNSPASDEGPCISADSLTLFFTSTRSGYGGYDIWFTTRKSLSDAWEPPTNLGPLVNGPEHELGMTLSGDGAALYFDSFRAGGHGGRDLWRVSIEPAVDFNGNGKVDFEDLSKLAQYWQQNERSVDMGPTPLGDGVVDIHDVAVLAEYWLTEPSLVAYWELDETEGFIAYDCAGDHDASVIAEYPLWRPIGGKIDGALELDGIDDHVSTPFVLDPAQGSFSVFLWVKGAVSGQVFLSQKQSTQWFWTAPPVGWLMSSLGAPLISQTVVTDGQWHRIGLTWDGTNRTLYVDDIEAAKDTQGGLPSSERGLNIGAGKDLDPQTFFHGLIDDVRIYDRAIVP